jgi:hypothetical protein
MFSFVSRAHNHVLRIRVASAAALSPPNAVRCFAFRNLVRILIRRHQPEARKLLHVISDPLQVRQREAGDVVH